ncbi:MAG: phosphatidylinositol mannoside acyltransferase [Promicromonosporaceae bacterium]|nr:phosphatidylinositol mannoside acyltransferase [Promicromonosporaceae bacterium]
MANNAKFYLFAWRHAPKVPEPILRGLFNVVADVAWLKRGKGVRRLEANYARVRPDLDAKAVRRLSRAGMRSYLRYFREAFTLQSATQEQINARVRLVGRENALDVIDGDAAAVLALGHLGNWDLAGAFATPNIAPVLTVAEKLKPEQLFAEFLKYRKNIGIEALGLGDPGVFDELVHGAKAGRRIICLLADRDLTARGVEVNLCGQRARVAAGPARVALDAGVDLIPTISTYERLTGERRRAAGTPWGTVLTLHPPVPVPPLDESLPEEERRRAQVATYTQGWVDALATALREHTEDWHMLQRVFTADLDPKKNPALATS